MVISKIQVDYAKFVMIPVKIASEYHQMIVLNAIHRLLGYLFDNKIEFLLIYDFNFLDFNQ
jgi:hypothetical protein